MKEALVRIPEVVARCGLSRPTIYRRMARGQFPRSVQLGVNSVAWRESDLLDWMREPMTWERKSENQNTALATAPAHR